VAFIGFLDLVLIVSNLFPPTNLYGDEKVGFLLPPATGTRYTYQSSHSRFIASDTGAITVNERGCRTDRTIEEIRNAPKDLTLCVIGDSQTELPYRLEYTHAYVLQRELKRSGLDTEVLAAGRGGFSPLQAFIYLKEFVIDLKPSVIILNLYTGNDLFDMMRTDDRPYYVSAGDGGYAIHSPVWYKYTDPADSGSVFQQSRVLYLLREVSDEIGLQGIFSRLQYLVPLAQEQGGGLGTALSYIDDLAETREPALDYPPAFAAQVLNQHLFFRYFPAAREESLRRIRFLLATMRSEYPDRRLVLSLIPSPVLCDDMRKEPVLLSVLSRVGLSMSEVAEEENALYDSCLSIGREEGWSVTSNREILSTGCRGFWMMEDLHLSPAGSRVVGENQADDVLMMILERE